MRDWVGRRGRCTIRRVKSSFKKKKMKWWGPLLGTWKKRLRLPMKNNIGSILVTIMAVI